MAEVNFIFGTTNINKFTQDTGAAFSIDLSAYDIAMLENNSEFDVVLHTSESGVNVQNLKGQRYSYQFMIMVGDCPGEIDSSDWSTTFETKNGTIVRFYPYSDNTDDYHVCYLNMSKTNYYNNLVLNSAIIFNLEGVNLL